MDQNRQIRFLIPPFFLLASLFWGDHLSCSNIVREIAKMPDNQLLAIVAAIGASTIPLGFLIGALPIAVFHLIGFALKISKKIKWNYESGISEDAVKKIWPKLNTKLELDYGQRFYVSATFDHGILPQRINSWTLRRWNAFNVNVNCCSALLLSHAFGRIFSIDQTSCWWLTTFIIMIPLSINAVTAWCQTMKMLEFQANRELVNIDKECHSDRNPHGLSNVTKKNEQK